MNSISARKCCSFACGSASSRNSRRKWIASILLFLIPLNSSLTLASISCGEERAKSVADYLSSYDLVGSRTVRPFEATLVEAAASRCGAKHIIEGLARSGFVAQLPNVYMEFESTSQAGDRYKLLDSTGKKTDNYSLVMRRSFTKAPYYELFFSPRWHQHPEKPWWIRWIYRTTLSIDLTLDSENKIINIFLYSQLPPIIQLQ